MAAALAVHRGSDERDGAGVCLQVLEGGKRFGYKPVKGYSGHQPTWRTEQWEHIQEQLTLRVRPTMRAPVPRMRSLEDELHDQSSAELREAKAAWSLIMENFEEFRKVQTAFRLVDKDYSGVISREELRVLIENALYIQTSDAAFDIIFNTIDKDGSGDISFDEFAAAISDPNIELTDAVATDENALTAIERRNALQQGLSEQAEYNVCATDALALFSKNEAIRISGSSFVIQNLRKKVDEHFYEIKTAFQNCDPELLGSMPSDEFVRVLRAKKLVPEGGEPKLLALVDSLCATTKAGASLTASTTCPSSPRSGPWARTSRLCQPHRRTRPESTATSARRTSISWTSLALLQGRRRSVLRRHMHRRWSGRRRREGRARRRMRRC